MRKMLRGALVLATIASLLVTGCFMTILLIGRINWQKIIKGAEAGSVGAQMMLADAYETGTSYTLSGFLLERNLHKARYWRQKICTTPGHKEYCSKFK